MKQLIIDNERPNGIIVEVEDTFDPIPYEQRVVNRIRERYSIDDELAILRQRDTKPEEFAEYNAYVERVKAEERAV
jgi:hypothetical protein